MSRRRLLNWVRLVLLVSGAALAMAVPGAADAMRVSPMVAEMTTRGTGAVTRIEVQNVNQANLPFETRVTRIDYDANGNMSETPADADFLVFPPQGVLSSGARQIVRLQWMGAPDMPASRAYYLSVNELPVAMSPAESKSAAAQVQVVYHMKALITVAPPKAAPNVEVVSAKPTTILPKAPPGSNAPPPPGPATPGVEVVVRNTGNRYAMMAGERWLIDGTGMDGKPLSVVLDTDQISHIIGVGYLAPQGGLRTFEVPTSAAFQPGSIKIRFGK